MSDVLIKGASNKAPSFQAASGLLVQTAPAIAAGVLTLALATSDVFVVSLGANITTTTVTGVSASGRVSIYNLITTGDGTPRTIVYPAGTVWINNGNVAPTPTATLNKRDKYTFFTYDGGVVWFASIDAQDY